MMRVEMIGSPLDHVRTPAVLNRLFERDGQDLRVEKREVDLSALAEQVAALRRDPGLRGLIITTPLKEAICAHLDRRTALVEMVGAANCVRADGGSWIGANFDGFGFEAALAQAGLELKARRVLLAGCGGAGKPIAERIVAAGAAALTIIDLDPARAGAFAERLRPLAGGCEVTVGDTKAASHEILVNATTLGMRPNDGSPFSPALVEASDAVIDIVVSEQPSRLERDTRRFGRPFVSGVAMVEGQAELFRAFLLGRAERESDLADRAFAAQTPGSGR